MVIDVPSGSTREREKERKRKERLGTKREMMEERKGKFNLIH